MKWMLALLLLTIFGTVNAQPKSKPNIILILADDMGYGEMGAYGQREVPTPNMDALAAAGVRFTNYYSGSTVCAPSRETLLTGMHTGHTAIRGNFRLAIDDGNLPMASDHPTMAEYLHGIGYKTALFGKWGLGDSSTGPNTRGFDYSLCYIDQVKAHDYYPPYIWENDRRFEIAANQDGKRGLYSHHLFADRTLDYIRVAGNRKPFFLYLAYTIPHGDYTLPPDSNFANKPWPAQIKSYATMITLLDKDIGRIVALLKEKGLYNNTLILFTSDNGANPEPARILGANGIFRGAKFGLYEGGIREPLVAVWPGHFSTGKVSDHIAAAWDLLPTVRDITGFKLSKPVDGISLLPTLTGGGKQAEHDYLYWEYYEYNYNWKSGSSGQRRNWLDGVAVRYGKWKGIRSQLGQHPDAEIELYDLEADPSEKTNVAASHPDIVAQIRKFMQESTRPDPPNFPYTQQ